MSRAWKGVVLITAVEVATMVGWLFFANRGDALGVLILTGGLVVEHYIAINVGAGRPVLGPLPPDKV